MPKGPATRWAAWYQTQCNCPIDDAHGSGDGVKRLDPHRLDNFLVLFESRMWLSIRPKQAIDAKVAIVRLVTKIAAVGKPFLPCVRKAPDSLVHPVPDKAALQTRVLFDNIPIFFQVAGTVAHRVGILAHHDRTPLTRLLGHRDDALHTGIHRAEHVHDGGISRRMVIDQAGRITLAQPADQR